MKCKRCGTEIKIEDAFHCTFCEANYCPHCAELMGMCDCYGDLERYM